MNKSFNLSTQQKNIWNTEMFYSGTDMNNIGGYIQIEEKVDFKLLEKSANIFVQKNDIVRARFEIDEGEAKQHIKDYKAFHVNIKNIKNKQELITLTEKTVRLPFKIIDSDLFRFQLFRFQDGTGGIIPVFHHLISDAWSLGFFINTIIDIYSSLINNEQTELEINQYEDYLNSAEEYLTSKKYNKDKEYWDSVFLDSPDLTFISKEKTIHSVAGMREICEIEEKLFDKIQEYCENNHLSTYTFFMGIFSLYLAKINSTNSSIIGTPVLNRSNYKEKHTMGMFVSTVPFRVNIDYSNNFSEFIKSVAINQTSIFRHQRYPYLNLLESIKRKYNLNDNLFDFVLSYQNVRDNKNTNSVPYHSYWCPTQSVSTPVEAHFYDMDDSGKPSIYYNYQTENFSKEDILDIHNRIMNMAKQAIENPIIKDIDVITKEEKKTIEKYNNTDFKYDKNKSLISIFEERVNQNPKKVCVIHNKKSYTYGELDKKSNQLANMLISYKIKKNDVIGIMLNRSFNIHIAMWGTMKAGASYLLIDPSLPEERIKYMLENANAKFVITDMYINYKTINMNLLDGYSDEPTKVKNSNNDRFCIIYTSGSTGTPKGVQLKRLGIINMVNTYNKQLKIGECENFLSTSTVAFDMFMAENMIPILSGKTVILANEDEQKIPSYTSKLIVENDVHFILSTPSKISLLLMEKECLKGVKLIQLGGEVFKPTLYRELKKATNARIYNSYGPCECTGCTTNKLVTSEEDVSIGIPIYNVKLSIQNHIGNEMPIGTPGELVISGDNVGIGYLNKPEFNGIYRTGDMAMFSSDGKLEYCGRKDNQIKFHGLRIELDEITQKIMKIDGVNNAVTVIKKVNNIDCICSYIILNKKSIEESEIKKELMHTLPAYMVPAHVVFLEKFNITLNGKIDTKSLPDIVTSQEEYVPPVSQTEKKLEKIWSDILKIEHISINSDFFDIGGDSLCAIRLISIIDSEFSVELKIKDVFENTTISSQAKIIDIQDKTKTNIIEKRKEFFYYYPVTSMQKGIYYASQMNEESLAYNTPFSIIFNKVPDINKLEKALNAIINNHESFRTYFVLQKDDVFQRVKPNVQYKLKITNEKDDNFVKRFDLSVPPLIHTELVIEEYKAELMIDIHHIICDGTSIQIFAKELCDLYNEKDVNKSEYDYLDFAVNQKINDEDKEYWKNKFKDEIPLLNIPTEYERTNQMNENGNNYMYSLNNINEINSLCKKLQITPFMFFLTCYYILLYKYTMQNDIVVGTPVDCRSNSEFYKVIGMFVNTICLRQNIEASYTFEEFAKLVKDNCLDAFNHKEYPFDELVQELDVPRISGRNPIFDVLFSYESQGVPKPDFNGLETKVKAVTNTTSKFDFTLEVTPTEKAYNIRIEYATELYGKKFIANIVNGYENIIKEVINDSKTSISKINITKEKFTNNESEIEIPKDKKIIDLFEEQVQKTPNKIALVYQKEKYTYKELKEKVDKLASYISELPEYKQTMEQKNKVIGIMMNRSSELIISILAVLKVGAGYLPIDPTYPEERINYIIDDSKVKFILTQSEIKCEVKKINVDDKKCYAKNKKINAKKSQDDLAYLIYTSGSTGNPKGVMLTELNVINFIYSMQKQLPIKNNTIVSVTTMCFDIFVLESLFPLCSGIKVVMASNDEQNNPQLLNKLCKTNGVDMIQTTPSKFKFLISDEDSNEYIKNMKMILLGGEPFTKKLLTKLKRITQSRIYNMYGPTETTVWSTMKELTEEKNITIGKPINNTEIYVLDNDLNNMPQNVPGKLFIGGLGVAKGYLNRGELTNQKFINHNGNIIYDTGDLVKLNSNNDLEYIGRTDFQVKVRGLRIELGEIENAILSYPRINECVVTVKNINDREVLCGYYIADNRISNSLLRNRISKKLPNYMIPTYLMQIDNFEYTPNGKIDRKKLPTPKIEKKEIVNPKTLLQKKILVIWKELLSIEEISINDNFFEIGGDSLCALKLQLELRKINIIVDYSDIFKYNTIEELSYHIEKQEKDEDDIQVIYKRKDFRKVNKALRKNKLHKRIRYNKQLLGDVLITGATGFLGIHVLAELLKEDNLKIYCLVREDPSTSAENKLKNKFKYYFGSDLSYLFGKRIIVVQGDIGKYKLGLNQEQYKSLAEKVKIVINCSALVKHYGRYEDFRKINVKGTRKLIDFCEEHGQILVHTSTLSVSGNTIVDLPTSFNPDKKTIFSEKNLYVNQKLDNVYVRSKFEAEKLMLEELANKKLRGIILRIGNITNRTYDGKFQDNSSENAFLNRLKAFLYLKEIPKSIIDNHIEFSPVDSVANAIVESTKYYTPDVTVLHLYNSKHISIKRLVKYLKELGIEIKKVEEEKFEKNLTNVLYNSSNFDKVSVLLNDLDSNNKLVYKTNLITTNDFTLKFLNNIGFDWPEITKEYIKRILENL